MTHETWEEWLQIDFDGELETERRTRLREHVASCPQCEAEARGLTELRMALQEGAAPVRPDFASAVMSALPAAGWESRHARSWAAPLALIAVLGGGAAVLAGVNAAQLQPAGQMFGAFGALFDLFSAAVLAGAGLLQASWRGVGLALGSVLAGSWVNVAAFGLGVVGLNLLLLRLVRRGRPAEASVRHSRR